MRRSGVRFPLAPLVHAGSGFYGPGPAPVYAWVKLPSRCQHSEKQRKEQPGGSLVGGVKDPSCSVDCGAVEPGLLFRRIFRRTGHRVGVLVRGFRGLSRGHRHQPLGVLRRRVAGGSAPHRGKRAGGAHPHPGYRRNCHRGGQDHEPGGAVAARPDRHRSWSARGERDLRGPAHAVARRGLVAGHGRGSQHATTRWPTC